MALLLKWSDWAPLPHIDEAEEIFRDFVAGDEILLESEDDCVRVACALADCVSFASGRMMFGEYFSRHALAYSNRIYAAYDAMCRAKSAAADERQARVARGSSADAYRATEAHADRLRAAQAAYDLAAADAFARSWWQYRNA